MFLAPIATFLCGALVVMLVNETYELRVSKRFTQFIATLSVILSILIVAKDYIK